MRALKDQNWETVYSMNTNNINGQWDEFMNTFLGIFNQSFSLKNIPVNSFKSYKSHPEVRTLKQRLDWLLTISRHNVRYKEVYKASKRKYDDLVKNIRVKQYESRINTSDNKMKCMWAITKEITGKSNEGEEVRLEGAAQTIADNF